MTYEEALAGIHSMLKFGMKLGLERMEALLECLDHPERELRFLHVAGTNGKGSTCQMLSRILTAAGYKTGLFTSPYVVDFRERIQCGHRMIPKEALAEEAERVFSFLPQLERQGLAPTEFEAVTAMALDWFRKQQCDVVVLEVGLGGKYDSTNVIGRPLASVITSISYDHMNVLGTDIRQIAGEKAGIIKEGGVTVLAAQRYAPAEQVVLEMADARQNKLFRPNLDQMRLGAQSMEGTDFSYRGETYRLPLLGTHQVENALTVLETIRALNQEGDFSISQEKIQEGIGNARMPARMECLCRQPPVFMDGAHNEDGVQALAQAIRTYFGGKPVTAVFGTMEDKEYKKTAALLAPLCRRIITATPGNPRALPAARLAEAVREAGGQAEPVGEPLRALERGLDQMEADGVLLVCGSLYLASDLRQAILEKFG